MLENSTFAHGQSTSILRGTSNLCLSPSESRKWILLHSAHYRAQSGSYSQRMLNPHQHHAPQNRLAAAVSFSNRVKGRGLGVVLMKPYSSNDNSASLCIALPSWALAPVATPDQSCCHDMSCARARRHGIRHVAMATTPALAWGMQKEPQLPRIPQARARVAVATWLKLKPEAKPKLRAQS